MERQIIHLNVADFYVSVEQALAPRLRGRPVAVASEGMPRAIVYDISEEAWKAGVFKGMPLDRAKKLCPDLEVISPRPQLYERAMQAIFRDSSLHSPMVEIAGPGHLFLDMTGVIRKSGQIKDKAINLKKEILDKYRLEPAVGVAINKLVSKVATRVVKPRGFCYIPAGEEADFLAPLPVYMLPCLNEWLKERIKKLNIRKIAQLSAIPLPQLNMVFGKYGLRLYEAARGIDNEPVKKYVAPQPSVREEMAFAEDTNDEETLIKALYLLVERGARRLRDKGMMARRLSLHLLYTDKMTASATMELSLPLDIEDDLFPLTQRAFLKARSRRVRIRQISLSLDQLIMPSPQMSFFVDEKQEKKRALIEAIDHIRDRYGWNAIYRWGRGLTASSFHLNPQGV